MVERIEFGINSYKANLKGKTIAQVKKQYREHLNIPSNAVAVVGNEKVDNSYVVQEGDTVEFIRKSGKKGGES